MFRDEHIARMKAGAGGNGSVAFIRESNMPKGGPAGGDGGRGGDVVLVADENYNTLYHLRHHPNYRAERGEHGMGSNCHGKTGADVEVHLPLGSVVTDTESGERLATRHRKRANGKRDGGWLGRRVRPAKKAHGQGRRCHEPAHPRDLPFSLRQGRLFGVSLAEG